MLRNKEEIKKAKGQQIKIAPPIMYLQDKPLIYPNSIVTVQGQTGVHKSRLTQTIGAAFMKNPGNHKDIMGLKANFKDYKFKLCYIDTERNLKCQFPHALQMIESLAGYGENNICQQLEYTSLLNIKRNERLEATYQFLEYVSRDNKEYHIVVVLDVLSDCIIDFNNSNESLELVDLINEYINEYDVSFICVIHENPGSEKARGHLGTEVSNKASTVIQTSIEKEGGDEKPDVVKINIKKFRNQKKRLPLYVTVDDDLGTLSLLGANEANLISANKGKLPLDEMVDALGEIVTTRMHKDELYNTLEQRFNASSRTVHEQVKQIIELSRSIKNREGVECKLYGETIEGKKYYSLRPYEDDSR